MFAIHCLGKNLGNGSLTGSSCTAKQIGMPDTIPVSPAAVYTMQYIISTPVEKLYTFTVSDEVLENLKNIIERYRNQYIDRRFKSLEILTMMEDM